MRSCLIILVVLALGLNATIAGQGQPQKKFMGGPVTIEDQGSFFIGGVHEGQRARGGAVRAARAAGAARRTPQQITIGQMYVQFQIPARAGRGRAGR